jgi:hypothetical protein
MQQPTLLIQLPVPQIVCQEITGNIPLAAAALRLHALHAGVKAEQLPKILPVSITSRAGDCALIDAIILLNPPSIGFTATVWNIERSQYIASRVKELRPQTTIIFGGPDVAADSYWIANPVAPFDYAVEGEGETFFAALLQGAAPETIKGILMPGGRLSNGEIVCQPLPNLTTIHDPFVLGLAHPETDGVVFAEFYRGCKYRCSFCRYHQGRMRDVPAVRSQEQVGELFAWAHDHEVREIYILDPSLEQRPECGEFLDYIARVNHPTIDLFCELRPDHINDRIAGKLHAAGVRSVEAGLQTMTQAAIKAAGRRFQAEAFIEGVQALLRYGVTIRTDVMLGLPADTPQGMDKTCAFLLEHNLAKQTQVFRTQALPGTHLRQHAVQNGVCFEERPPYFIVSTPTWPAEDLETSSARAESLLQISHAPEDRPLLVDSCWKARGYAVASIDAVDTVFFYGFQLDNEPARGRLDAEDFTQAGNAVTLYFATSDSWRDRNRCVAAIDRFFANNPFASITVILELAPNAPLDILDEVNARFDALPSVSRYCERMYSSTGWPHPTKRIFTAFPDRLWKQANHAWLADVDEAGGIIIMAQGPNIAAALNAAGRIEADCDYLFLDIKVIPPRHQWPNLFETLKAQITEPELILLPAPNMHWAFIRWQEEQERMK